MGTYYNQTVLDNGLSVLSSQDLDCAICQLRPTLLRDVQDLKGSGGKRITEQVTVPAADIALQDDGNGGRQISFDLLSFTVQVSTSSDPLWVALHNGTDLLVASLARETHSVTNGDPLEFYDLKFGFAQSANQ